MTDALRLSAPAKVNLALRVVGRRPDGYHELETVFQTIDLCDELVAARAAADRVELTVVDAAGRGLPVASGDDNLVVRAARAVLAAVGRSAGLRFHLVKRVPAGGGLGGGSSDAAAALRLTNALLGAPLDGAALAGLALRLGADVPFFLFGGTCFGAGVGERLWPVVAPPRHEYVLILPPFGTATARVFELLGARLIDASGTDTVRRIEPPTASEIAVTLRHGNDLEEAAMTCTPALRALRDRVRDIGFADVRMSGSGSTLFVTRPDRAGANAVRSALAAGLSDSKDGPVALLRAASSGSSGEPVSCSWPDGRWPEGEPPGAGPRR